MLEVLAPELEKQNVTILQPLSTVEGRPAINTIVFDHDSEEVFESAFVVTDLPDPQKMGSSITYSRRYALISLLSLQQLDDDANITKSSPKKSAKSATTTKTQVTTKKIGAW